MAANYMVPKLGLQSTNGSRIGADFSGSKFGAALPIKRFLVPELGLQSMGPKLGLHVNI